MICEGPVLRGRGRNEIRSGLQRLNKAREIATRTVGVECGGSVAHLSVGGSAAGNQDTKINLMESPEDLNRQRKQVYNT